MVRVGDKGGENTWNTMFLNEGRSRPFPAKQGLPDFGVLVSVQILPHCHNTDKWRTKVFDPDICASA